MVVASRDAEAVVKTFGLRTVLPANWQAGLAEAMQGGAFVTPSVDGHVFVVGADVQALADPETDVLPLLQRASGRWGRACWFHCDAAGDRFGWALVERGEVVRAYAFAGEHGHTLWLGEVTPAERELGCFVDDPRDRSDDDVKWWPDRTIVHALAATWALDPDAFAGRTATTAAGAVGRL